jgi:hypothetical protein
MMFPMPIRELATHVPETRPPDIPAATRSPAGAHAQGVRAPGGALLPAAASPQRFPSASSRVPWLGANVIAAVPTRYRSSDASGIFVEEKRARHLVIRDGKSYPAVDDPTVESRKAIGLKGGGDTDQSAYRRELEQRKVQIDQKHAELSGVQSTLQGSITNETRRRDDAQRAVSTRETGKRLAEQWLEELRRKQQQGEPDLQSMIDTQRNEVRGWETELQRAQQVSADHQQSLARLEDTLRILTTDLERVERERSDVEREIQRL